MIDYSDADNLKITNYKDATFLNFPVDDMTYDDDYNRQFRTRNLLQIKGHYQFGLPASVVGIFLASVGPRLPEQR